MFIKPAYGAVYETEEEVIKAWESGVDFMVLGRGPYMNKKDFENYCDPLLDSLHFVSGDLKITINTGILI